MLLQLHQGIWFEGIIVNCDFFPLKVVQDNEKDIKTQNVTGELVIASVN